MCTVTYIPLGNNRFLLTSNRDENLSRSTSLLKLIPIGNETVLFPMDPVSGGSWIATSNANRVACVLNGAFEKHKHTPPYRRSRGLILLDYFRSSGISDFASQTNWNEIEPFTMIVYEDRKLIEFRWDGSKQFIFELDYTSPRLWSSCTLYDHKARVRRSSWFDQWWNKTQNPGIEEVLYFHRNGGDLDLTNGFVMNRENRVQTLSITGIDKKSDHATMHHHDLISQAQVNRRIDFSRDEIVESY